MPGPVGRNSAGRAGSSTIVQAPFGTQVTKPTQAARALTASRKVFYTADDLKDPERLHQVIYQQGQAIQTALHAQATNPQSTGVMLQGVPFTTGQTQYLNHGLGRAYTGWYVARRQGPTVAYATLFNKATDGITASITNTGYTLFSELNSGPSLGATAQVGGSPNITIATAGVYAFTFTATIENSAGHVTAFTAFVNGVGLGAGTDIFGEISSGATSPAALNIVTLHSFNAGDAIDIRALDTTGTSTLTFQSSQLSVRLLGGEPFEVALPSGVTSDKQLGITCPLAGTYSFWVF